MQHFLDDSALAVDAVAALGNSQLSRARKVLEKAAKNHPNKSVRQKAREELKNFHDAVR